MLWNSIHKNNSNNTQTKTCRIVEDSDRLFINLMKVNVIIRPYSCFRLFLFFLVPDKKEHRGRFLVFPFYCVARSLHREPSSMLSGFGPSLVWNIISTNDFRSTLLKSFRWILHEFQDRVAPSSIGLPIKEHETVFIIR